MPQTSGSSVAPDAVPGPVVEPAGRPASMSRRTAWFLLGVAVWMVFVWGTFARNLADEEGRPTGFYVAHTVLIVVDLAIAAVLAVVAVRVLRSRGRAR